MCHKFLLSSLYLLQAPFTGSIFFFPLFSYFLDILVCSPLATCSAENHCTSAGAEWIGADAQSSG